MADSEIVVTMDRAQLDKFLSLAPAKAKEAGKGIIRDLTWSLNREEKIECPVDKGVMRASIRSEFALDGHSSRTGPTVNYAECVVRGTRPHRIHARPGGVLRFPPFGATGGPKRATFFFGGKSKRVPWVFAKFVDHPGTKPNDFIGRAADKILAQASDVITARLESAMGEAAKA